MRPGDGAVRRVLLWLLLAVTACGGRPAKHSLADEHGRVHALLYREGLIEDADVRSEMTRYVARMRAGTPPAVAYPEFRLWLERWERDHPARARAARQRFAATR